jgi:hypothetical protein
VSKMIPGTTSASRPYRLRPAERLICGSFYPGPVSRPKRE